MCVKVVRKRGWSVDKEKKKKNPVELNKNNNLIAELKESFLKTVPREKWKVEELFGLYFTKLVSTSVSILNCDDCGRDGHFLLAAPGPPKESPQSRGTCAVV